MAVPVVRAEREAAGLAQTRFREFGCRAAAWRAMQDCHARMNGWSEGRLYIWSSMSMLARKNICKTKSIFLWKT